jgi:hypothetical protein
VGQTELVERVFNIFPSEGLIKREEYGTLLVLCNSSHLTLQPRFCMNNESEFCCKDVSLQRQRQILIGEGNTYHGHTQYIPQESGSHKSGQIVQTFFDCLGYGRKLQSSTLSIPESSARADSETIISARYGPCIGAIYVAAIFSKNKGFMALYAKHPRSS